MGRGRRLDRAFAQVSDTLIDQDRRWAREASYGVVRLRGRLDHLLSLHVRSGLESLDAPVLDVLRLGAYQLFYMDAVPAYAAVSETVDLARAVGLGRASGLVNAVLRALQREGGGEDRFPSFERDPLAYLTTWGSHPEWLLRRWLARWPPEQVRVLVEENNRIPALFLRPLGRDPDLQGARDRLAEAGVEVAASHAAPGVVELAPGASLTAAFAAVPCQVQDPGAALVVRLVEPPDQGLIADLCAAPGGKAMGLAGTDRMVVAADPSAVRLRRVRQNARRLGASVWPVQALAQNPPLRAARVVLLDVPCSGTGTFRRHPDGRWRLEPGGVTTLVDLQEEILEGAASVVEEGGLLVYSTCTLEPEENEEQVRRFLGRHPEFRLEPPRGPARDYLDAEGFLRVEPHVHGFDGAFAARMKRAG